MASGDLIRDGSGGDIRPRPDPTVLTTQALLREIGALRDTLETRMDAINTKIETRLDGMDKAIELVREHNDRMPDKMTQQVALVRALYDERFAGGQRQLQERDVRAEQATQAAKEAVSTAFQASKEASQAANDSFATATAKAEASTAKQRP